MVGPERAGVSEAEWKEAVEHCHELRVARTIEETHDAMSIVFEIPDALRAEFAYRAGQFLSFKVAWQGRVLTRSYSLSSAPETDPDPKVTVKRVDDGRISNWMNEEVRAGTKLMVVPPAGLFVLDAKSARDVVLFSGGSGITPCISIVKSALAASERRLKLVYANRDERSIIFREELDALRAAHPGRLEIVHSLDDRDGFVTQSDVGREVGADLDRDFYLCGPTAFMDTVEHALRGLGVDRAHIHIERFIAPPDHGEEPAPRPASAGEEVPSTLSIVLDGTTHEVPYRDGERVLEAARRAGLDPPFSCEEGYCSCCMAKLSSGRVEMAANDCLTPELVGEGWVLTCQSRCFGKDVKIEYPD